MLEDVFEGVHKLFPKKSPPVILQHSFLLNTKIAKLISERYVSKKLQLLLLGGKAKFYSIKTLKIAKECLQINPMVSRIGICRCLIVSRSQNVYITLKTLVPFMTLKFIWRPGKVTDRLKIKRSSYARSGSSRLMFRLFILRSEKNLPALLGSAWLQNPTFDSLASFAIEIALQQQNSHGIIDQPANWGPTKDTKLSWYFFGIDHKWLIMER